MVLFCRPHVSFRKADGAKCGSGAGQYTGEPEHTGVLSCSRKQWVWHLMNTSLF